jgi:preprotein translocase subunit SecE
MARASTRRNRPQVSQQAMGRINPVTFLREVVEELKKSVWPTKQETMRLTGVVIALAVSVGFLLGGLDRIFEYLARFVF